MNRQGILDSWKKVKHFKESGRKCGPMTGLLKYSIMQKITIKWNSATNPPKHGKQVYVRKKYGSVGLDNYSEGWISYNDITHWHELLDANDIENEPFILNLKTLNEP